MATAPPRVEEKPAAVSSAARSPAQASTPASTKRAEAAAPEAPAEPPKEQAKTDSLLPWLAALGLLLVLGLVVLRALRRPRQQ